MLTGRLGINRDADLAGSAVYSHGAWIPVGNAQIGGFFMYLEKSNLLVVASTNAGHNPNMPNWFDSIKQAYVEVAKTEVSKVAPELI